MLDNLKRYYDAPVSKEDLNDTMLRIAVPSLSFYLMMAAATIIATLGLITNSPAAIIGAMIIAPLMGPIMGLAFGMVTGERKLLAVSFFTVVTGAILVVGVSYGLSRMLGLSLVQSEIAARGEPSLIDLGIALAAGLAAAFAYTRVGILNAVAGVAIAVALVPPLAVTGIGLELGHETSVAGRMTMGSFGRDVSVPNLPKGAFLLFATNLVGIVLVAVGVFAAQQYGRLALTFASLIFTVLLCGVLLPDLRTAFERLYIKGQFVHLVEELAVTRPDLLHSRGKLEYYSVNFEGETIVLRIDVLMPKEFKSNTQNRLDAVHQILAERIERPLRIEMDVHYADIVDYEAGDRTEVADE